jgi:hypothetical protein
MRKLKVAPAPTKGQARCISTRGDPRTPPDRPCALSAEAPAGSSTSSTLGTRRARRNREDTIGWLRDMSLQELAKAIETARAEFVKAAELHRSTL